MPFLRPGVVNYHWALATSKNVLFSGHNHLLTTGRPTGNPSLAGAWAIIKVLGHQHWWLAGGIYDLETGFFRGD